MSYVNNKKVTAADKSASVKISFKGSYKGTEPQTLSFKIRQAVIGEDVIPTQTALGATGKAQKPVPVMLWASTGKTVSKGMFNYEYPERGIKDAGDYQVKVTAKNASAPVTRPSFCWKRKRLPSAIL